MKMVKIGMILLTALSFSAIQAQTADEIVNKYIDAVGGKDKLAQIKTVYMENTSEVMGNSGPSTINIVNGLGYKMTSDFNGQTVIICVTDKGGWQVNPFAGAATASPLPDDVIKQTKGRMDATGPLYNYAAKGNKVELLGKEGNDYKLKVTSADSTVYTMYIDGTTYYLTKIVTTATVMGSPVEAVTNFSNFKKADMGLVFPYTIEINYGQFVINTTVNKIELNKTIDPSIFEMPKS